MWRGAIVAVILLAGCQARLGSSEREDTAPDAGGGSADPGSDDAGASAVTPDAAAGADAAAPVLTPTQRCQARYSAIPGFEICSTTGTSCSFIAINEDVSCDVHCAAYGGVCLAAADNNVGECSLETDSAATCQTTGKTDLLCTCTIP